MPLDESLITSEVCVKCGHCCKWTSSPQYVHPVNGPEWLNIIAKTDETTLIWHENERLELRCVLYTPTVLRFALTTTALGWQTR